MACAVSADVIVAVCRCERFENRFVASQNFQPDALMVVAHEPLGHVHAHFAETSGSDFHQGWSFLVDCENRKTIRSGFAATWRRYTAPAHASAFDYPGARSRLFQHTDCSKTAL